MEALLHLIHNDHGEWSAVTAFLAGLPAWRAFLAAAFARLSTTLNHNPTGSTGEE